MSAGRYESERAAWLLSHEASWHLGDRRMADTLRRRAARSAGKESGSTEALHHQGRIKPFLVRFLSGSDEASEFLWRVASLVVLLPLLALLIGPALVVSLGIYAAFSTIALNMGRRPRALPWLPVATVVAGVSWFFVPYGALIAVEVIPYFNVHVQNGEILPAYIWVQGVAAAVLVAVHVRRHGWPGAPVGVRAAKVTRSMLSSTRAGDYDPSATTEPSLEPDLLEDLVPEGDFVAEDWKEEPPAMSEEALQEAEELLVIAEQVAQEEYEQEAHHE